MGKGKKWDAHVAKKMEYMLLASAAKHCAAPGAAEKRGAWSEVQAYLAAFELAGAAALSAAATKAMMAQCKAGAVLLDEDATARLLDDLAGCGARLGERDVDGASPLHRMAALGSEKIVAILLKRGADPASRDVDGQLPEDAAAAAGHGAVAESLRAAREAREAVSALHGDALWVLECDARRDGGAEAVRMVMAFELAGDAAKRLREAEAEGGSSRALAEEERLEPVGRAALCRAAFKAWAGVAKSGSAWDVTLHGGAPEADGFGRLVAQHLSVGLFKDSPMPKREQFEALAKMVAGKCGSRKWTVLEPSPGMSKSLSAVSAVSLVRGTQEAGSSAEGAKMLASLARAELDRDANEEDEERVVAPPRAGPSP